MGKYERQELRRARLVASAAATIISLACGTNVSLLSRVWGTAPVFDIMTPSISLLTIDDQSMCIRLGRRSLPKSSNCRLLRAI